MLHPCTEGGGNQTHPRTLKRGYGEGEGSERTESLQNPLNTPPPQGSSNFVGILHISCYVRSLTGSKAGWEERLRGGLPQGPTYPPPYVLGSINPSKHLRSQATFPLCPDPPGFARRFSPHPIGHQKSLPLVHNPNDRSGDRTYDERMFYH